MDGRYLNSVAQGLLPYPESVFRFERLPTAEQIAILEVLEFMASQAGATAEDSAAAIAAARFTEGFCPDWIPSDSCVHISTDYRTAEAAGLSEQYRYLMRLFSIADGRRRKMCGGRCGHWWHNLERK